MISPRLVALGSEVVRLNASSTALNEPRSLESDICRERRRNAILRTLGKTQKLWVLPGYPLVVLADLYIFAVCLAHSSARHDISVRDEPSGGWWRSSRRRRECLGSCGTAGAAHAAWARLRMRALAPKTNLACLKRPTDFSLYTPLPGQRWDGFSGKPRTTQKPTSRPSPTSTDATQVTAKQGLHRYRSQRLLFLLFTLGVWRGVAGTGQLKLLFTPPLYTLAK